MSVPSFGREKCKIVRRRPFCTVPFVCVCCWLMMIKSGGKVLFCLWFVWLLGDGDAVVPLSKKTLILFSSLL